MIEEIGHRAREASHVLRQSTGESRRQALLGMAAGVEKAASAVLEANRADMAQAEGEGITGALIDRLRLDERRISAMAAGLRSVASLARSGGPRDRRLVVVQRGATPPRPCPTRRRRRDIRGQAQRDCRCSRSLHPVRQRRDPAWLLLRPPLQHGHLRCHTGLAHRLPGSLPTGSNSSRTPAEREPKH